jgi:hypothetical protein
VPHVRHAKLPELQVRGRRLGRHIVHDERSRDFEAERAAKIVSVEHATTGLPLDQGNLGSCTANALAGAVNTQPNYQAGGKVRDENDAIALYKRETADEGEPYPPNDPGGSGLAVCKAAIELGGWISSYTHAFGVQHALEALVKRPVITGVSWYDSFDQPDKDGLVEIKPGAQVRGGHEFVVVQIIAEHELVGADNSWGLTFGLNGRFYFSFETWDALLQQQGDVTVPVV